MNNNRPDRFRGRGFLRRRKKRKEEAFLPSYRARDPDLHDLIGSFGRCITPFRNCGYVMVFGRKIEAFSPFQCLEHGDIVRIIGVEMNRLIVEAAAPPFPQSQV